MAEPAATTWTKQQQDAISTLGKNILVSAAAGSGKTSVLAERCAHLVCDAPKEFRCDVDELLVVTFTVAAATEMRTRISAALHKRYEVSGDQRLARQLALIDRAQIGTIHSFCSTVIRQSFHSLGIDPNFSMISEEEGTLLRSELARDLCADRYEIDEDGAFQRLVDRYGDGNDLTLRWRIIRAAALLESLVRPEQWLAMARLRVEEAAAKPLTQSTFGNALVDRIGEQLASVRDRLVRLIAQLESHPRLAKYFDFATEILACVESWKLSYQKNDFDGLATEVKNLALERFPAITKLTPEEATLKAELTAIRDQVKCGELASLCRFSESEWREGMRRIVEPTNVFLALVAEFRERYKRAKDELRVLDFADLERLALRALSDSIDDDSIAPSAAARAYRKQFAHVLVDEYQDVNELQDTILSLVSRDKRDAQAPNFFCVGDVKQSIYRFRLAEPKRFLARYETFKKAGAEVAGLVIDLQTNFRSRSPLLVTLNCIFQRLMTKEAAELHYDESQFLQPRNPSPYDALAAAGAHVELHLLSDNPGGEDEEKTEPSPEDCNADDHERAEREAAFIAQRIGELMGHHGKPPVNVLAKNLSTGGLESRPIRFGDIAILLRSMQFKAEQFATTLRAAGIAVHTDSGTGFFEAMEVRDVLALLKVLDNPRQDIPLAAVLRSPLAAIAHPEDALARIRLAYNHRDDAVPFHVAVTRYAKEQADELAARLRDLLSTLSHWRQLAMRRPLAEVLWTIYDASGYLAFCEGLDDGEQRVANLISLHDRARQFGSFRRQGLGRFMRFLDSLREETELGSPSVASEADDVVRIMSVHRSKGLEFPIVFLPDLGKRHNLQDCRGTILFDRESGIGLQACDDEKRIRYPSLASTIVSEQLRRQMLAEEMRVLYVATTRARERLILLGTCKADRHETWKQQWAAHRGALPTDTVLGGSCMLDWIGPALTAMSGERAASFEIHSHPVPTGDEVPTAKRRAELTPRMQSLAKLERLSPAPKSNPAVDAIWNRLTQSYPFDAFTKLQAANSVTAVAKGHAPLEEEIEMRRRAVDDGFVLLQSLRPARAGAAAIAPTAADIGTATHLVLEHLDYSKSWNRKALDEHLDHLINQKLIEEKVARTIDLDSLAWFLETDLAEMMRKHATKLLREISVNVARPPEDFGTQSSNDPLDRVMLRGRLDALLAMDDGAILIDFKTDNVDAQTIDARVESYRPQINAYAAAIRTLTSKAVKESHLVFLKARITKSLNHR